MFKFKKSAKRKQELNKSEKMQRRNQYQQNRIDEDWIPIANQITESECRSSASLECREVIAIAHWNG